MAEIKSFTDLNQAKVLSKILPLESADMYYRDWKRDTKDIRIANVGSAGKEDLPCWSLSALLGVLPIVDLCTPTLKMKLNHKYYMELCIDCVYHKYLSTNDYDSPVDACVAMIEKLHKIKLL